jgi:hypothetical protein
MILLCGIQFTKVQRYTKVQVFKCQFRLLLYSVHVWHTVHTVPTSITVCARYRNLGDLDSVEYRHRNQTIIEKGPIY